MAAVAGRAPGFIAELYYVPTVISDKSEANLEAAAVAANRVIDTASMGALARERNIISVPVYGEDVAGTLAGQADPGTFDFNVTLNFDNTVHTAIRDDNGRTQHTFIVRFFQDSDNFTLAAFDGFIANASVSQPIDDRIQMDVSIARSGAVTWVDDSA